MLVWSGLVWSGLYILFPQLRSYLLLVFLSHVIIQRYAFMVVLPSLWKIYIYIALQKHVFSLEIRQHLYILS